ncbi:MAG: hypothetical protein LBD16_01465 [Oscillospiraceae bacterium]|nr:hypothetical protein [Oscillospiraceae bacterium]
MPGITSIADKINAGARSRADEVLSAAKAEADEILSAANAQAAAIKSDALAKADKIRVDRAAYMTARARREYSQGLLKAKRDILASVVSAAKVKMESANADAYFADIAKWIAANAHKQDGALFMNAADIARLPKGFVEKVNASLGGGSLVLKERAIPSGCVLRYDDAEYGAVEENGTLGARFDERRDALIDAAAAALNIGGNSAANALGGDQRNA